MTGKTIVDNTPRTYYNVGEKRHRKEKSPMNDLHISDSVRYIGADDTTIDLFESQYPVPNGVSYNSYLILDEKIAVMDTVDRRAADRWLENMDAQLQGRSPDYLVIQHLEPDHAGSIGLLLEKFPEMQMVGNAKTFSMLPKYFPSGWADRSVTVKEGHSPPGQPHPHFRHGAHGPLAGGHGEL